MPATRQRTTCDFDAARGTCPRYPGPEGQCWCGCYWRTMIRTCCVCSVETVAPFGAHCGLCGTPWPEGAHD